MKKFKKVQYQLGRVWTNPQVIASQAIEQNHADEFNAQFENTGIRYIEESEEVPEHYTSEPTGVSSAPKNVANGFGVVAHLDSTQAPAKPLTPAQQKKADEAAKKLKEEQGGGDPK